MENLLCLQLAQLHRRPIQRGPPLTNYAGVLQMLTMYLASAAYSERQIMYTSLVPLPWEEARFDRRISLRFLFEVGAVDGKFSGESAYAESVQKAFK